MYSVIFDMDGVIFDSENIWKKSFILANEKFNLNLSEEFRQKTCGMNENDTRVLLKTKYPNLDIESYRNFMGEYFEDYILKNKAPLKEGFLELLDYLKKKKYKIALATGNDLQFVKIMFKSINLSVNDVFDYVITGEQVLNGKPNPEVYEKAVKGINETPQNCIVLEDSLNGIKSATSAGCKAIMVIDIIKPDDYAKNNAFKIYDSLLQVKDLLQKIDNN